MIPQEFHNKAIEILTKWRKTPCMYASDYEAWMTMVLAIMEFVDVRNESPGFFKKHIGTYGNSYLNLDKKLDDEWAHKVIDEAINIIKINKLKAFI